jgi:monovalent cation:H+ antiporter-2, CPA2 family
MEYLEVFFALLCVSIFFTLVLKKINIEATLGYLITGIILGPHYLGIIKNHEEIAFLGELGIILLLFNIGVELSFNRLKNLRHFILGLGFPQFIVTSIILSFIMVKFFKIGMSESILIGSALSLSSTALIMQILSKQSELSSKLGKASFCVLLFQDIAVVPIIMFSKIAYSEEPLISMLSGISNNICVALFLCIILGKFILKPLFRIAAEEKTYDAFMMMTLATIIGISIITLKAGLSVELGAFLAGLMLSETSYRHRVEADIQPFRGILLGMFFISIGMQMNHQIVLNHPGTIIAITLILMFIKSVIMYLVSISFGIPKIISMRIALIISGCGEFAFVLLGSSKLLISNEIRDIIYSSVSMSMIITPFLDILGRNIFLRVSKLSTTIKDKSSSGKVIIIGYNEVSEMLVKLFDDNKISYMIIDNKIERVEELNYKGVNVVYGSPTKEMLFDILDLKNSTAFIINIQNQKESIKAISEIEKGDYTGKVIIRVLNESHRNKLESMNIFSGEMPESTQSAIFIGKSTLIELGFSIDEAEDALKKSSFL